MCFVMGCVSIFFSCVTEQVKHDVHGRADTTGAAEEIHHLREGEGAPPPQQDGPGQGG